jgi:hypothetical protein
MEFTGTTGLWGLFAIIIALTLVMQFAFKGLVLAVGAAVLWGLSGGRIRRGEFRHLGKAPPKPSGGAIFYYEGSHCYMYQNYVGLIGLVTVLLALTAVFGVGMWLHAP